MSSNSPAPVVRPLLPASQIVKHAKAFLPPGAAVGRDSRVALSRMVTCFTLAVGAFAAEHALAHKRMTVQLGDVAAALATLGLDDFASAVVPTIDSNFAAREALRTLAQSSEAGDAFLSSLADNPAAFVSAIVARLSAGKGISKEGPTKRGRPPGRRARRQLDDDDGDEDNDGVDNDAEAQDGAGSDRDENHTDNIDENGDGAEE